MGTFDQSAHDADAELMPVAKRSPGSADRTGAEEPDVDDAAFGRLYATHAGKVAAFVLRRADRDDVADIVAETFLVAWRRWHHIPAEPMTRAWLYGVARKVTANQRRSRTRRNRLTELAASHLGDGLAAAPAQESWQAVRSEVIDALGRLSPDDRELLFLVAWEELTPAEIAYVVDLPPAVVHQRLYRARKRLRQLLVPVGTK